MPGGQGPAAGRKGRRALARRSRLSFGAGGDVRAPPAVGAGHGPEAAGGHFRQHLGEALPHGVDANGVPVAGHAGALPYVPLRRPHLARVAAPAAGGGARPRPSGTAGGSARSSPAPSRPGGGALAPPPAAGHRAGAAAPEALRQTSLTTVVSGLLSTAPSASGKNRNPSSPWG